MASSMSLGLTTAAGNKSDGIGLGIDPSVALQFNLSPFETEPQTTITLSHPGGHNESFAFKIKTTHPCRYRLNPNLGLIGPNGSEQLQVFMVETSKEALLQKYERLGQAALDDTKFMVQSCRVHDKFVQKYNHADEDEQDTLLLRLFATLTSPAAANSKRKTTTNTPNATSVADQILHTRHTVSDTCQPPTPPSSMPSIKDMSRREIESELSYWRSKHVKAVALTAERESALGHTQRDSNRDKTKMERDSKRPRLEKEKSSKQSDDREQVFPKTSTTIGKREEEKCCNKDRKVNYTANDEILFQNETSSLCEGQRVVKAKQKERCRKRCIKDNRNEFDANDGDRNEFERASHACDYQVQDDNVKNLHAKSPCAVEGGLFSRSLEPKSKLKTVQRCTFNPYKTRSSYATTLKTGFADAIVDKIAGTPSLIHEPDASLIDHVPTAGVISKETESGLQISGNKRRMWTENETLPFLKVYATASPNDACLTRSVPTRSLKQIKKRWYRYRSNFETEQDAKEAAAIAAAAMEARIANNAATLKKGDLMRFITLKLI